MQSKTARVIALFSAAERLALRVSSVAFPLLLTNAGRCDSPRCLLRTPVSERQPGVVGRPLSRPTVDMQYPFSEALGFLVGSA